MVEAAAPAGTPGPVAFSTSGVPHEQRIELWENHNEDALIGLRCRTLTAAVLDATEINLQVEQGAPGPGAGQLPRRRA